MKAITFFILITFAFSLIFQGCNSTTIEETSLPQITNPGSSPTEGTPKPTVDPIKPTTDNPINGNSPSEIEEMPVQPSPIQYQITVEVHPLGAGEIATDPPGDLLDDGTEVTLLSTPETGFLFDYWLVNGQRSENITSMMIDRNKVIDAYFIPNVNNLTNSIVKGYIDKQNEIVLIDVRSPEDYEKGHIPGAMSIPSYDIENRWNEIPKDRIVFVYASCVKWGDNTGTRAVQTLRELGITNAIEIEGGYNAWAGAGFPLTSD